MCSCTIRPCATSASAATPAGRAANALACLPGDVNLPGSVNMVVMEDTTSRTSRTHLRATFNQAADRYHRARPDYPAALFDELIAVTGLQPGDRLLEVGCATGKATLPLAERGFRITCIELGAELAAAARSNLARYDVEVRNGQFEVYAADET